MAVDKIRVDADELRSAATKIRAQIADYKSQYTELFSHVDEMQNAWKGVDNVAFTSQIKETLQSFTSMEQLLEEYSAFLEKSAQIYDETQGQIASAAKQLST